MNCKKCSHFLKRCNKNFFECELYPNCVILFSDRECPYFNVDMTEANICGNCTYFLGGSDWGLSCQKNYYKLPEYTTESCKDFKKIGE